MDEIEKKYNECIANALSQQSNNKNVHFCKTCCKTSYLLNKQETFGYCLNCGTTITKTKDGYETIKGEGCFVLLDNEKFVILPIEAGKFEQAFANVCNTARKQFGCSVNDLDYFILHHIKDDKTITIDFKDMYD